MRSVFDEPGRFLLQGFCLIGSIGLAVKLGQMLHHSGESGGIADGLFLYNFHGVLIVPLRLGIILLIMEVPA